MTSIKYNSEITSYNDYRINGYPAEIREKKRNEIKREHKLYKLSFFYSFLSVCLGLGSMFYFAFSMEGSLSLLNFSISISISTIIFVSTYIYMQYFQTIKKSPRVPLSGNEELKYYGMFDFREKWILKEIDVFKQFDDSKIVIDATVPGRTGFPIMILLIVIITALFGVYPFSDLIDENIAFTENMGLLIAYSICLIIIISYRLYSPKSIVVFDRESKIIIIPAKWVFSKGEAIPYDEAIILFGAKVEMSEFRGDERVVIANPNRLLHSISMRFYGRTNGYCFARFISEYMTRDDVSQMPEFALFKEVKEEIRQNELSKSSKAV